jgi:transposase, IS5 family
MGQPGFFDLDQRLEEISAKGDALETIKKAVAWEDFRADIEAATERTPEDGKSNAGRRPYDAILKFKVLVLQSLYNFSDEQTEFMIRDRLSFMRFLDLGLADPVPDATTIWLFREALVDAHLVDKLFDRFGQHLQAKGYIARGGQIVDATIVSAPRQRNTKEENEAIKTGETPKEWEKQPTKLAQKDVDARWTKKNDESFYGYKNHIGVDKAHKLIRKWDATDAAVHDNQKLDDILDPSNTAKDVWADSAYRSAAIEQRLREKGLRSRIHRRAVRGLVQNTEGREHDALKSTRACRARVRTPGELDGPQDRSHHRHCAGEVQDRHDEPRLQHPPSGSDRAGGGGACLSGRRGWSLHRVAQIGLAAPCGASKRARNGLPPARLHGRTPN